VDYILFENLSFDYFSMALFPYLPEGPEQKHDNFTPGPGSRGTTSEAFDPPVAVGTSSVTCIAFVRRNREPRRLVPPTAFPQ